MTEQGRPPPEDKREPADLAWFAQWAETTPWTMAKTVPEAPHAYWRAGGDPVYPRVRDTIRAYGTPRVWPQPGSQLHGTVTPRRYRYLQVGEWEFWVGPPGFVNRGKVGRLD